MIPLSLEGLYVVAFSLFASFLFVFLVYIIRRDTKGKANKKGSSTEFQKIYPCGSREISEKELEEKIEKAEKLIENIGPVYTVVAPPHDDMKYWDKIGEILELKEFQWLIFAYRNEITASMANDIQDDKRFLTNLDQVAGGIKTIDNLMLKMRKLHDNAQAVLESEKNQAIKEAAENEI